MRSAQTFHPHCRLRRSGNVTPTVPSGRGRACVCGEPAAPAPSRQAAPPFCAAISGRAAVRRLGGALRPHRERGPRNAAFSGAAAPPALWLEAPNFEAVLVRPQRGPAAVRPPSCPGHAELKTLLKRLRRTREWF